jgi:hypothetical protein
LYLGDAVSLDLDVVLAAPPVGILVRAGRHVRMLPVEVLLEDRKLAQVPVDVTKAWVFASQRHE